MTYEEKKKLIDAAKLLQERCKKWCNAGKPNQCPFYGREYDVDDCSIHGRPRDWQIPTITRWTPEDVALAKALKAFGAKAVFRYLDNVYWRLNGSTTYPLPSGAFKDLRADDRDVLLDTIIEEAEG